MKAQGEAQSVRLIGQAIQQNPSFLTLRKIEVRPPSPPLAPPLPRSRHVRRMTMAP